MKFFRRSPDPNTEMNFLDHLEALRWHLVRATLVIFILAIVAFIYKEILFDVIIFGPKRPDFITYRLLCKLSEKLSIDMCITDIPFTLISTTMAGQFTTHMVAAGIAGLIMGFPYLLWEIWRFVKPALTDKEKRYTRGIVFSASFLFFCGVAFGYFILSPLSINFLGSYQVSEQVKNAITIDSYISIVTLMTLACGAVFELPILVFFLTKIGIITPKFMRSYRKHAFIVNLIIAALITPSPDVTSQLLVAIPLLLLYEFSIFVSVIVARKEEKQKSE
ncbi:MAG: twin-arginine translocase subunit TatC [Bacteroidia bacterium]